MKQRIIVKIKLIISKKARLSESEASHLLTLIRKALEHLDERDKAKYPILRFYCDWALHIKIDRSSEGWEIIRKLNSTIVKYQSTPDNNLIIEKVSEVVSLRKLRNETKEFFKSVGLPPNFVADNQKWDQFSDLLVEILLDGIIALPKKSKKTEELYKSLTNQPIKNGVYVVEVKLVKIDKSFFEGKSIASGIQLVGLRITTNNKIHLIIPINR